MKARKGNLVKNSAKENQTQNINKIKRGVHNTPSISYIMERTRNLCLTEAYYLNNQITIDSLRNSLSDDSIKKGPMKCWKRVDLAYKVHKWRRPDRLLIYRHAGVTIEDLKYTGKNLVKFCDIRRLHVTFLNLNSTRTLELDSFCLKITRNLTRLRHFSLSFYNCWNIAADTVINIGYDIGRFLVNLQSLELSFGKLQSSTDFCDDTLKSFGLKLFRHIRSIQSLEISFYTCDSITDNGFETLIQQIRHFLQNLKSLRLALYNCKRVTDKGMELLRQGIVKLPTNLERLGLNFSDSNVTDRIFEVMISMMTYLTGLQHLDLCLCRCQNISDAGLDKLKQAKKILNQTQLKSLTIWLAQSKQVSIRALSKLPSALRFIKNVELPTRIKINPDDFTFSF